VLAYVFWHSPLPEVARPEYELALVEFHRSLGASGSHGFLASQSYRIHGAAWINGGGDAYADWYLIDGSAALDPLNEAAVTGAQESHHGRVAAMAAGGAGGLYRRLIGTGDPARGLVESWLTKPKETPYAELYERLRPFTERESVQLWRRQMVLGPAPEFCLVSDSVVDLPAKLRPMTTRRDPLSTAH
jgi:hypothetical protein